MENLLAGLAAAPLTSNAACGAREKVKDFIGKTVPDEQQ